MAGHELIDKFLASLERDARRLGLDHDRLVAEAADHLYESARHSSPESALARFGSSHELALAVAREKGGNMTAVRAGVWFIGLTAALTAISTHWCMRVGALSPAVGRAMTSLAFFALAAAVPVLALLFRRGRIVSAVISGLAAWAAVSVWLSPYDWMARPVLVQGTAALALLLLVFAVAAVAARVGRVKPAIAVGSVATGMAILALRAVGDPLGRWGAPDGVDVAWLMFMVGTIWVGIAAAARTRLGLALIRRCYTWLMSRAEIASVESVRAH